LVINDLNALRRGLLSPPISWIAPAPCLHTTDLLRATKVIAIAVLAEPMPLAGGFAGLSTAGLETIALTVGRPRIRNKELTATAAFASARRTGHRAPNLRRTKPRRKPKRKPARKANSKKEEET